MVLECQSRPGCRLGV
ncbi:hypothetical protein MTR67_044610 [Solanum verrucosum]|nr:hypothetical protein MTR67_044610 [Solanum verrucosum]